jgi:hypothetical protein
MLDISDRRVISMEPKMTTMKMHFGFRGAEQRSKGGDGDGRRVLRDARQFFLQEAGAPVRGHRRGTAVRLLVRRPSGEFPGIEPQRRAIGEPQT